MRWDNLFDDLEGQLEQELSAEELDLRAEEERLRLGRLALRDRILAAHEGRSVDDDDGIRIVLTDGTPLTVRPITFGRDWFSADLRDDSSRHVQAIIPIASIGSVAFTARQAARSLDAVPGSSSPTSLPARLTLSFVLRDLCRRRSAVELQTPLGSLHGTIDRIGRDHLDLAVHDAGEARRQSAVQQLRVIPFNQVLVVRLG
jgi:hypothetical protein